MPDYLVIVLTVIGGAVGGAITKWIDWLIGRKESKPHLWVSTAVSQELFVSNTGKLDAYEVIVFYVPTRLRVWGNVGITDPPQEPEYFDLNRLSDGWGFGSELEFPMRMGDQVKLHYVAHLIEPLMGHLSKLDQFAYLKGGNGPSHVTLEVTFDVECQWFEAGQRHSSESFRRGMRSMFSVACGYNRITKEWGKGEYTIDPPSIGSPKSGRYSVY